MEWGSRFSPLSPLCLIDAQGIELHSEKKAGCFEKKQCRKMAIISGSTARL
jgi:hypothetical protein